MRKLAHVLFFTIITILTVHHVNFVSATEEAKNDLIGSHVFGTICLAYRFLR